MSKIKSVIAGLGIVAGLGVAMAPLTSYADEVTNPNTVTAVLNDVISMTLVSTDASGSDTMDCHSAHNPACTGTTQSVRTTILPGHADTSSMYTDIYVSTNTTNGFNLTVADSDTNNNLQTTSGDTIAAIANEPIGGTRPGWAIRIDDAGSWLAMPTSNAQGGPILIKSHQPDPAAVSINVHSKVTYGVAASDSQASGTYTDTIVYTVTTR